jgi:hypothetical protein
MLNRLSVLTFRSSQGDSYQPGPGGVLDDSDLDDGALSAASADAHFADLAGA